MNITICGGGNLGHVCAGYLGANESCSVSLLTNHPERWNKILEVNDPAGKVYRGRLQSVSSCPENVIPLADIVLVCLPGFAIHDVLQKIAPYLASHTWVGTIVSSTGFFFEAKKLLQGDQPLFGFQRVPFISRIINYGHSAQLKGYKDLLSVAVEHTNMKDDIRQVLEQLFNTPTKLLDSFYEVSLSNSNPLLHPSRLYTLWKDWQPCVYYMNNPFFYADWTLAASELLVAMDEEFQQLLEKIGVKKGSIPSVLDYYESKDTAALTLKIRSIPAFQGILSPMKTNEKGLYEPDFTSRYFTEDFPYGMRFIVETAKKYKVETPLIDRVYNWGTRLLPNE